MKYEYVLETKDLAYIYAGNKKPSLEEVSIKIKRGVKTVLLGANGAGKSTLFYHFNGVFKPTSGVVEYEGESLNYRKKALKGLRSEVAVVLQNPDDQIFCSTVEEDVAFGPRNLGLSEKEVEARVENALFQTGMMMLRKQGTLRLSYGQRKRLALAGAIAMNPKVLIMDEPTAGLDPQMAQEVMELADQLHHCGTTVVISTHDVDLAYAWADEIHVLRKSRLIYSGTSEGFYFDAKLVHTVGLMPPSMFSINQNYESMICGNGLPYPRTLSELVSKMTTVRVVPGKLYVVSVSDSLTQGDIDSILSESGTAHIGIFGTGARKIIFKSRLSSDFVFNGIDNCLMDAVRGRNSILCCEDRYTGMVLDRVERLKEFGTDVEVQLIFPKSVSKDKNED